MALWNNIFEENKQTSYAIVALSSSFHSSDRPTVQMGSRRGDQVPEEGHPPSRLSTTRYSFSAFRSYLSISSNYNTINVDRLTN